MTKDSRSGNEVEHSNLKQALFNGLDELNKFLLDLCIQFPIKASLYGIDSEAKVVRDRLNDIQSHAWSYSGLDMDWFIDALNQCAIDVETLKGNY